MEEPRQPHGRTMKAPRNTHAGIIEVPRKRHGSINEYHERAIMEAPRKHSVMEITVEKMGSYTPPRKHHGAMLPPVNSLQGDVHASVAPMELTWCFHDAFILVCIRVVFPGWFHVVIPVPFQGLQRVFHGASVEPSLFLFCFQSLLSAWRFQ